MIVNGVSTPPGTTSIYDGSQPPSMYKGDVDDVGGGGGGVVP